VAHSAKGSLRAAEQLTESVLPWLDGGHAERLRPVEGARARQTKKASQ
jgi:hypothetical protein